MRLERAELLSAGCASALLLIMFGLAWYGVVQVPGHGAVQAVESAENGWSALPVERWLVLATALAGLVCVPRGLAGRPVGLSPATGLLILGLGSATSLLLADRVLIDLPWPSAVPDQKLGAVLGLCAALGIALGGWDSIARSRLQ